MHILTQNIQYGYKAKISTIDAIMKIETYLDQKTGHTHLLLMDLSKAFGAISRTLLWTTLYKKDLSVDLTLHIRRGRKQTKLMAKTQGRYGKLVDNYVGVFPGSAISALLPAIYLDDMVGNYASLNYQHSMIAKHAQERAPEAKEAELHKQFRTTYSNLAKDPQKE